MTKCFWGMGKNWPKWVRIDFGTSWLEHELTSFPCCQRNKSFEIKTMTFLKYILSIILLKSPRDPYNWRLNSFIHVWQVCCCIMCRLLYCFVTAQSLFVSHCVWLLSEERAAFTHFVIVVITVISSSRSHKNCCYEKITLALKIS